MSFMRSLVSLATSVFGGAVGVPGSRTMPPAEELFDTPLSAEADAYLTACNTEFNAKQQRFMEQWLADCEHYDVDFEHGIIRITRESGPPVTFDVALVGSHDRGRDVWEWAWNNPNVGGALAVPKAVLAPIGEKFDLGYLLSGFIPMPPMEEFPWYLCGIALKVTGAPGAYVASNGDMDYYLLLENPAEGVM